MVQLSTVLLPGQYALVMENAHQATQLLEFVFVTLITTGSHVKHTAQQAVAAAHHSISCTLSAIQLQEPANVNTILRVTIQALNAQHVPMDISAHRAANPVNVLVMVAAIQFLVCVIMMHRRAFTLD
jgi:hypothetical protein